MIDAIIAWFTPEVIANLIAVGKALVLLFGCVICAAPAQLHRAPHAGAGGRIVTAPIASARTVCSRLPPTW
jgi:hypothetical protein